MLVLSKAVTHHAFDPITVYRQTNLLFRNHQTQARIVQIIRASQQQKARLAYLEYGTVKDSLKFR